MEISPPQPQYFLTVGMGYLIAKATEREKVELRGSLSGGDSGSEWLNSVN